MVSMAFWYPFGGLSSPVFNVAISEILDGFKRMRIYETIIDYSDHPNVGNAVNFLRDFKYTTCTPT
jgi:hypothetical protein